MRRKTFYDLDASKREARSQRVTDYLLNKLSDLDIKTTELNRRYFKAGNNYFTRLKEGKTHITLPNFYIMCDEINLCYDSRIMNAELRRDYRNAEYWKSEKIKFNETLYKL